MAEPRLQRRYNTLVMSQLTSKDRLACGNAGTPDLHKSGFAAVQGAWRFYANESVTPAQLADPLLVQARSAVAQTCHSYVLVPCDWSFLSFTHHRGKHDRTEYSVAPGRVAQAKGYELFSMLALSDTSGQPLAPLAMQLRHAQGVTGSIGPAGLPTQTFTRLDKLAPAMRFVRGLNLGQTGQTPAKTAVFLIDSEADSVGHYRQWSEDGHLFVVRADMARYVRDPQTQAEKTLKQCLQELQESGAFREIGLLEAKGQTVVQRVAEMDVVLHRPARQHRVLGQGKKRKKKHINVPGLALRLRLVVSELRSLAGELVARWLLLTNVPERVPAAVVATWYYYRWRIETYHKLLKGAGLQVESWRQEDGPTLLKRLLVSAMGVSLVWSLARDETPEGAKLRAILVRLSGRQMARKSKRKPAREFTEPALLAGLGILLPMLTMLETTDVGTLSGLLHQTLGLTFASRDQRSPDSG